MICLSHKSSQVIKICLRNIQNNFSVITITDFGFVCFVALHWRLIDLNSYLTHLIFISQNNLTTIAQKKINIFVEICNQSHKKIVRIFSRNGWRLDEINFTIDPIIIATTLCRERIVLSDVFFLLLF